MLRPSRTAVTVAIAGLASLWAAASGCGGASAPARPPAPAPAPIHADDATAPGSAEAECATVATELRRYSQCGLLDDDRKAYLGRWLDAVEVDLALAKSPSVDDAAKAQLAVSCRKAGLALADAATRCAAQAAAK
jgi:hypothetical protein